MEQPRHIKILRPDPVLNSTKRYERSLENYLEKRNRVFNIEEESYLVYVSDKRDALSLGVHFNLDHIEYFDGYTTSTISLSQKGKETSRAKTMVTNTNSGDSMTLGRFKSTTKKEIRLNFLTNGEVVKRGILTKKDLNDAIKNGKLNSASFGNREYIARHDLVDFLKSNYSTKIK